MLKEVLDDLMTMSGNQYNANVWLTDVAAKDILNKLQHILRNNLCQILSASCRLTLFQSFAEEIVNHAGHC